MFHVTVGKKRPFFVTNIGGFQFSQPVLLLHTINSSKFVWVGSEGDRHTISSNGWVYEQKRNYYN